MMTTEQLDHFFIRLLGAIAAPTSPLNLAFMHAWARKEGTRAKWNPLATTQGWQGATVFNSAGVKNYPSEAAGVAATARTMLNGRYDRIVTHLRNGRGDLARECEEELNTWGSGALPPLVVQPVLPFGPRLLRLTSPMMHGVDVLELQQDLRRVSGWPHAIDGWFGPLTDRGVRDVQTVFALAVDGVVGPLTRAALRSGT